jgi:hypothetical protein
LQLYSYMLNIIFHLINIEKSFIISFWRLSGF